MKKGAHYVSVILRVPIDQVISANQRTQGNKGRKGISLTACRSNFVQNLVNCITRIENLTALSLAKPRNLIGAEKITQFGPK